jgi:hypothetical protein
MGSIVRSAVAGAVLAGCLALASGAGAVTRTVCESGCQFNHIQQAVNAAAPGATITVGAGNYVENLVLPKAVTLKGAGPTTVVFPSKSMPVCAPGSLCAGLASNIVLVQASNVTISSMTLEGDNPGLTSGVVVGGKDIDARNGIITNHEAGTFNNLTVTKVTVADVYLRGVYASSGGTFNFNHDKVENVQGEGASIGMFDFGGSGAMTSNHVTAANDAISANWSKGTQFVGNVITKSGSGVHTDNNGGEGGSADLIKSNVVRECTTNGYGIFVFVPYVSATVEGNRITGCAVGLAVFGSAVSGQGPTFSGNRANGTAAATTGPTYGAYLTTDELGFGYGDLTATLTGNMISHFGTGLYVTQTSPTEGDSAGGQATVTASPNNSITRNGVGAVGEPGTKVDAIEDWWGCEKGPNMPGCQTVMGTVEYTPWLTVKP